MTTKLVMLSEEQLRAIAVELGGCRTERQIARFVENAMYDLGMAESGLCPDCQVGPIDFKHEDRTDGLRWFTFTHSCGWVLELAPRRAPEHTA